MSGVSLPVIGPCDGLVKHQEAFIHSAEVTQHFPELDHAVDIGCACRCVREFVRQRERKRERQDTTPGSQSRRRASASSPPFKSLLR